MYRPVVPGGAGCAMADPDFGRSVNPISTRETDYAQLITTGTPGFSDLRRLCCDSPSFLVPVYFETTFFFMTTEANFLVLI